MIGSRPPMPARSPRALARTARLTALAWLALAVPTMHAAEGKLSGAVTYEKVPFRDALTGKPGLQLRAKKATPVIGARVELLHDGKVVGKTVTDATGTYTIAWKLDGAADVSVRVVAASSHVEVRNDKGNLHAVRVGPFRLADGATRKDVRIKDGSGAGAFNILEVIRRADALLRQCEPKLKFPPIKVEWTPGVAKGTYFRHLSFTNNRAFILGDRGRDSDEYDDYILLHEYGHFVMRLFSTDDSPGGNHSIQNKVDPRLAWSEGWAHYFACAVLGDPLYVDTGAQKGQQVGLLTMDLDANDRPGVVHGVWSEYTVATVLWDLHDRRPPRQGDLHLGLGFPTLWQVLRGPFKDRRHASLIDFCDELVALKPQLGPQVARVLGMRGIDYRPGQVPSVKNPFLRPLQFGKVYKGTVDSLDKNYLSNDSSDIYTFRLAKKSKIKLHLKITASRAPKSADVDVYLYDRHGKIAWSNATNGVGGTESIVRELPPGVYYVHVVSYFNTQGGKRKRNAGSYTLQVAQQVVAGK